MIRRGGLVPGILTLLGGLAAVGAVLQRAAALRNQRIVVLPSSELLYEWAILALLFAAVALLWQIRDRAP
jgi:hypothetical protein